ncbi:ABC transporter substrate-binding protein [Cytobacillus gottheilii]|uniref:Thiamine pyrimidine synthase n=1 Tax=Cytobacillus gottheilii TaxID=859144 RepID=A0ABX8F5Q6_9BACI|nr:ABC transporter substrate-binding protein [Cytobacillus gottheilii]QVY59781.1 ABC transporter substrate-binding protein [Cytobacillus gottheilii]
MRKIVCMILCTSFILFACSSSSEDAGNNKETEKITIANWSKLITEQTNLLVDEEKGFFSKKGLEVEIIPGNGGGDAIKNILSGNADIAFTDPGSLFFALDQGEKLKVIYNIYPQNVFNIVSLKENNLTRPEDLKGKTIGVYSLSSGTRQNLLIALHQAGLTENDVKIVETGLLNFAPLIQGQVDATAATDTGLYTGQQKGLGEVDVIEVKDYLNMPSDVFVVTEKYYKENEALLKAFLQSYKESAEWMIENPNEAAELAAEYAIDGQDTAMNLEIIKLRNKSSIYKEDDYRLGEVDPEVLQDAADTYFELGLIKKKLDMNEVIDDLLYEEREN